MTKKKFILGLAGVISALMLLVSCGRSPKPNDYELVGKYRLEKSSMKYLINKTDYKEIPESYIELFADKTLYIRNISDCVFNGFGDSKGKFISSKGKWEIEITGNEYILSMYISNSNFMGTSIVDSKPYNLEICVGDPDMKNKLKYLFGAS
jgi:hypothetical protein